ncbi:sigma-70 family RNA polymerase sigma factor [Nostoc sp.]
MATDLLSSYLKDIGRHPLLTPEEEVSYANQVRLMVDTRQRQKDIARQIGREPTNAEVAFWLNETPEGIQLIHSQGRAAKERIATANLRLVVMVAKKYQNRNMEFIDLIQEGSLGLYKCIENFDPSRGYKFSTYAYWWIRQGITRAISEKSHTIRLPFNVTEKLNRIKKLQGELHHTLGRYPTIAEIAQASFLSEKKIVECLNYSRSPTSLNLCVGKDEGSELGELLESDEIPLDEQVDQGILRDNLNDILRSPSLTSVQREVLILRYGINSGVELTLDQVAKRLNLSRERIRQINNQAIYRLQQKHKVDKYSF